MVAKRKTNSHSNAIALIHICALLSSGSYTKNELVERTGLTIGTVIRWMKLLEVKHLIYVAKWHRDGVVGQWAAKWSWGYKVASMPKPKPMTQSQYNHNSKIRKQLKKNSAKSLPSFTLGT